MAAVLRFSVSRIIIPKTTQTALSNTSFFRKISSRTSRGGEPLPPKPAPWPYQLKRFTILNYFTDKTSERLDENSKIIVVEGPIASGKSAFAKELANELDMLYLPEANLDMVYINHAGFDLKTLDDQLPEACRSFDVVDFLKNPRHGKVATFQINQYIIKYSQYIDALAHLLSTGQGVVLDRCVYSDFVFTEAMLSQKFISKPARGAYYDVRKNSISELMRPHLVIYLDVPVEKTLENIKKRNISVEVNSPALTPEYLSTMEKYYKQHYLKEISKHAELMVYDWSEGGDPEIVIEDIERIDFGRFDSQDAKMKDWDYKQEEDWAVARYTYAVKKDSLMTLTELPLFSVPELVVEAEDYKAYIDLLNEAPGMRFQEGYDSSLGDSVLFKTYQKPRETLPLRERRFP